MTLNQEAALDPPAQVESSYPQNLLDAFPHCAAVLNLGGNIMAVNLAWRSFSDRHAGKSLICGNVGDNYLRLIAAGTSGPGELARFVYKELRRGPADYSSFEFHRPELTIFQDTFQFRVNVRPIPTCADLALISIVTDEVGAHTEVERNRYELERLYRASETLLTSTEPGILELGELIVETMQREFDHANCSLFVLSQDRKELRRIAVAGPYATEVSQGILRVKGPGVVPRAIRSRSILNIPDVHQEPNYVPNWKEARSELAVPLISGQLVIGVIDIQSDRLAAFEASDERLIGIFAERAALALERTRLFEETRRRTRELEAVVEISASFRTSYSRSEMVSSILDQIIKFLHADGAALAVFEGDEDRELFVEKGHGGWEQITGMRKPNNPGVTRQLMDSDLLNDSLLNDPELNPRKKAQDERPNAIAAVPLIAGNNAIGTIWVGRRSPFERDEIHLLNAIADITANAFRRISLLEQTQNRAQTASILNKISLAALEQQNSGQLLKMLTDQLVELFAANTATITLWDEALGLPRPGAASGDYEQIFQSAISQPGEAMLTAAILEADGLVLIEDIFDTPIISPTVAAMLPARSLMGLPLISKNKKIGAAIVSFESYHEFSEEEVQQGEHAANQIAIALESILLFENLERTNSELSRAYDSTIAGWARALELRDAETKGHSQRVTTLTVHLAYAMGIRGEEIENIRRGALLHDIGKMGVPDEILLKRGPLNESEWRIMRQHPIHAYHMLASIPYLKPALDIPRYHHERWDGKGYPAGLRGEQIPLAARIFAVVDVWDALTSDRPYRQAWTRLEALDHIRKEAGSHFDPQIVAIFMQMMKAEESTQG